MEGSGLSELISSSHKLVDLDRLHPVTPVPLLSLADLLTQSDSRWVAVLNADLWQREHLLAARGDEEVILLDTLMPANGFGRPRKASRRPRLPGCRSVMQT